MTVTDAFLSAFHALPEGSFTGTSHGRSYGVVRQRMAGGRSHKLVAHERSGSDYISLNLYQTRNSGALLRPCEMPASKVIAFVLDLVPDANS
ncbi:MULTISPECIES: hypothetical protein [unclassified Ruegeria]|uniref:hypothetical protein n=1 Tax=unclassified Ruegeria TaxID=2625375 RepID=UPI001490C3CE|nr:hypothetical protein [Ruegeria sp. HKCCD5849]NOD53006.1 hypothetical protein [Ruegeria sp. HKCCD5851]NOD69152.1 hypothetical protein [Ruegeria sp. HKCCD7303]